MWFNKPKKKTLDDCIKLSQKNKRLEAIECFDLYLKDNPNDTNALVGKGNCLAYLQRYDEALNCYIEVTRLDSNRESAWTSTAAMYANLVQKMKSQIGTIDLFKC